MPEDLYVNKRGFKCVRSQLAKTEGRDPQEYERVMADFKNDGDQKARTDKLSGLKVHAPEYQ